IDQEHYRHRVDAIYFKAAWSNEFDKNNTYDTTFYMANGDETTCQMMYKDSSFTYCEKDLFQAVTLPYGYEFFNMTVFLPKQGVSIDALMAELSENWSTWWLGGDVKGKLHLPKFKFSWEMELKDVLSALGMGVAFDPLLADFMRIVEPGYPNNLFISKVKHKTFVDVNEEGTEAAAVTSVEMSETSMPQSPFIMRVDRPFVFVIWEEETNTIIFMGRVMEPVYD
ncbi:MAG: serpin family protein, partial [candidate division Zixibacteria bacterium]|nr:serpin family protein [candidate division Zixibacteria bacterium]